MYEGPSQAFERETNAYAWSFLYALAPSFLFQTHILVLLSPDTSQVLITSRSLCIHPLPRMPLL